MTDQCYAYIIDDTVYGIGDTQQDAYQDGQQWATPTNHPVSYALITPEQRALIESGEVSANRLGLDY